MRIKLNRLPPSVNQYTKFRVIKSKGIAYEYKTDEAKNWLKYAIYEIQKVAFQMYDTPVQLTITIDYSYAGRDLDNFNKMILDALKDAGVIKNDNMMYVHEICTKVGKRVTKDNEAVIIEIVKVAV